MIKRFLAALLAVAAPAMATSSEHAVIVRFEHAGDWSDFFQWEPDIEKAVSDAGYEYDGNDLAADGTNGIIYMYGSDADKLFAAALPSLMRAKFLTHKVATLRYGPAADAQAPQKTVPVDT